MTGRRTAAQQRTKKRRPAKMSTASEPRHEREKGTQGRANLNKAAGGQGLNAKDKMAKHAGEQKVAGRRTAAQAQREEAAPSEDTNRSSRSMIQATTRKGTRKGEPPKKSCLQGKEPPCRQSSKKRRPVQDGEGEQTSTCMRPPG